MRDEIEKKYRTRQIGEIRPHASPRHEWAAEILQSPP